MAVGATLQSSVTRFRPGSRGRRAIQSDGAGSADRKKRKVQGTLGDNSIRGYGKHTSQLRVVNIFVQQLLPERINDEAFGGQRSCTARDSVRRPAVENLPGGLAPGLPGACPTFSATCIFVPGGRLNEKLVIFWNEVTLIVFPRDFRKHATDECVMSFAWQNTRSAS